MKDRPAEGGSHSDPWAGNSFGTPRSPVRVLHVCETYASGVATSINAIVNHTPEVEHFILILRHRRHVGDGERVPDATYLHTEERVTVRHAIRLIANHYRDLNPDIVHAHSSYAGVYVRMLSTIPRSKIVYTPHCFSFERTDLRPSVRFVTRALERSLMLRTGAIAAMSDREGELARSLSRRVKVAVSMNVPDVPAQWCRAALPPDHDRPIRISTIGRICVQKDPLFFSEVVRRSRNFGREIEWEWIGDGAGDLREQLQGLGVTVTGWLDRQAVFKRLASSHLYLHTASWEIGIPLCVLEAAAVGVPAVVRSVPSTRNSAVGLLATTPQDAWKGIETLVAPERWRLQSEEGAKFVEEIESSDHLARTLNDLYQR